MTAVFRKEFRSSLNSMTGPIFICAVLAIMGYFVSGYQFGQFVSTHLEYAIVDGAFWALLLTPILTMRSFAEERKTKTDQLLYSLPITTTQVVLGKYLALVAILAIPTAVLCVLPPVISFYASNGINFAICYGSILAFFLLGCAVIAISMFISSLFESQVICTIVNLAVLLGLYFAARVSIPESAVFSLFVFVVIALILAYVLYSATKNYIIGTVVGLLIIIGAAVVYFTNVSLLTGLGADIVSSLFIYQPIVNFTTGVFDISCLVYYLSAAALFVFVTVQSFESRRWN